LPPARVTIDLTRKINTESDDTLQRASACGGADKIALAWNGLDEQIKDDNGAAWVLQVRSLPIKYPMQKSGRRDFTTSLMYTYTYTRDPPADVHSAGIRRSRGKQYYRFTVIATARRRRRRVAKAHNAAHSRAFTLASSREAWYFRNKTSASRPRDCVARSRGSGLFSGMAEEKKRDNASTSDEEL